MAHIPRTPAGSLRLPLTPPLDALPRRLSYILAYGARGGAGRCNRSDAGDRARHRRRAGPGGSQARDLRTYRRRRPRYARGLEQGRHRRHRDAVRRVGPGVRRRVRGLRDRATRRPERSEEHTSELQSPCNLVCRLLLEKKKQRILGTLVKELYSSLSTLET